MKGCIVVAEETKFGPIPLKGRLEETLPQLPRLGISQVELNLKYPFSLEKRQLKKLLADNSLKVAALASGYPYFMEGISFTDERVEAREQAVERIYRYIELAGSLESQVIIGSIRGQVPGGVDVEVSYGRFLEAMDKCLAKARSEGVVLALEPVNRYEMNLVNTVAQGLEVIGTLNNPNLKLLVDTFHMNIEEPSICESIREAGRHISHVHIADSNRWPMGKGHIDFDPILEALGSINYEGALSAELLPLPNPGDAVKMIVDFFNRKGL